MDIVCFYYGSLLKCNFLFETNQLFWNEFKLNSIFLISYFFFFSFSLGLMPMKEVFLTFCVISNFFLLSSNIVHCANQFSFKQSNQRLHFQIQMEYSCTFLAAIQMKCIASAFIKSIDCLTPNVNWMIFRALNVIR